MQDRVPLYPGRVTLTPVSGQANTFDLVRADQPTQEGTPLNKASLLKDATAALFGKTNAAVPDDVLSMLSKSALSYTEAKYTKTTIGTLAVGKTITLNVGGFPKEFIVVHHGKPSSLYDDSCNGTWLLMKDIYEKRPWHSENINKYESSDIHTYLNNTFLNLFESNIKDAIKQVKIPYVNGTGGSAVASGANGLSTKIFLLSGYELGLTSSDNQYFPQDGAKLSYFESGTGTSAKNKRIANLNGGAIDWWLRSPYTTGNNFAWYINPYGDHGFRDVSRTAGVRPALILPSTFAIYTDASGNIYTEQEYETKITDVLGNLIAIPADQIKDGVRIATGSYTGTGTYGASNPNSLTFEFEPKLVIIQATADSSSSYTGLIFPSSGMVFGGVSTSGQGSSGCLLSSVSVAGSTISWSANEAKYQLNNGGGEYRYIAIG